MVSSDAAPGATVVATATAVAPAEHNPAAPLARWPLWVRLAEWIAIAIAGVAMIVELVVTIVNIIERTFFSGGLEWTLDLSYVMLGFIAFLGASVAYHRGTAPGVSFIVERLSERRQKVVRTTTDWLTLAVAVGLAVTSISVAKQFSMATILSLGISQIWDVLPLTIGASFMALFALAKVISVPWRQSLRGAAIALLVVVVAFGLTELVIALNRPAVTGCILMFVLFFAVLTTGLTIFCALGLVSFAFVFMLPSGLSNLPAVPTQMASAASSSFLLLAIPFFVWAGLLMASGEPSKRIAQMIYALTGRFRGGAMQAVIYSMFLFSGISGSKIADMAMTGTMLNETAASQGYSRDETGGLVLAAACMGETIPPSIVMLLLASVTTLSITTLFAAGIVPALFLAVAMSVMVYVQARRRHGSRTERFSAAVTGRRIVRGLPSVALPVLLIWGILGGIATPTEASSVAVAYALLLLTVVYRGTSPRQLLLISGDAVAMSGMLLVLAAAAAAFAWAMATSGASAAIISGLSSVGSHTWLFWVVSMGAMIILGFILEGGPAFLIFGPIMVPLSGQVGISEIQFGICMLIAYGLGFFAPPFGAGIFMASAITQVNPMRLAREHAPYWLLIFCGLAVLVAVPDITLALPRALGLPGV